MKRREPEWDADWRTSVRVPDAIRSKDPKVNRMAASLILTREAALSIVELGAKRQEAWSKLTKRQQQAIEKLVTRMAGPLVPGPFEKLTGVKWEALK